MNFERQYLAALDALIVALGGVVPVAAVPNFELAHLLRLVALVQAVGGALPSPSLNYEAAVMAHWRAAIAARGGVVPTVYQNYQQGLWLHVQAFQATRGASAAIAGRNFEESILALVSAAPSGGGYVYDADAAAYIAAVEAADGQALETSTKLAFDDFFKGIKADGDLARLRSACILGGARTLAGALVPLVATMPTPISYGFVAGDRSRALGLLGNGVDKYLDTTILGTSLPQNNVALGVSISAAGSGTEWIFANGNVESGSNRIVRAGGLVYYNASASGNTATYDSSGAAFFGVSRSDSSSILVADTTRTKTVNVTSQTPRSSFMILYRQGGSFSNFRLFSYFLSEAINLVNYRSRLNTLAAALATL